MKHCIVCVLFAVLSGLWLPGGGESETIDRPNVLFISVDDLNDWIGVLGGHPQSRTPNLDRLAGRGVIFGRTYCAAPACNPSRAALMTGVLPSTSGVYHNRQPWRSALPEAVTIPQHFMAHGYWAGGSGKIYHDPYPDPLSWNEYFPSKTRQKPIDPLPSSRPINGIPNTAHFDWGPVDVDEAEMGDSQVADRVIQQLSRKHDRSFFLACGMYRPHLPWYVPRKYFEMFPLENVTLPEVPDHDLDDVPLAGRKMARPETDHRAVQQYRQWQQAVQGYLASIAFSDAQVGRVIAALHRSEYADNTIVVLWTDHGWHLGEKHHWRKFALWEEATRTPMIWVVPPGLKALPQGTAAGSRCDEAVGLIDIYPTLVELCGLKPRALQGKSLVPLLSDPGASRERPALTTHGRNNHSIRDERWRYIRYADGSEELYDHDSDPNEWTNLVRNPEQEAVKKELARWLPEVNAADARAEPRH